MELGRIQLLSSAMALFKPARRFQLILARWDPPLPQTRKE